MCICKVILSFCLGDAVDKTTQFTGPILVAKLYTLLVYASPIILDLPDIFERDH